VEIKPVSRLVFMMSSLTS